MVAQVVAFKRDRNAAREIVPQASVPQEKEEDVLQIVYEDEAE
jgi:hypothetical protein